MRVISQSDAYYLMTRFRLSKWQTKAFTLVSMLTIAGIALSVPRLIESHHYKAVTIGLITITTVSASLILMIFGHREH